MPARKKPTSFSLSARTLKHLAAISDHLGISQAGALEQAIRRADRGEIKRMEDPEFRVEIQRRRATESVDSPRGFGLSSEAHAILSGLSESYFMDKSATITGIILAWSRDLGVKP